MVGDGHCDSACNSEACGWDGMDCGCAPGCGFEDIGTCKPECFVPQCDYGVEPDKLLGLSCQDATYIDLSGMAKYQAKITCDVYDVYVTMNCCENCCEQFFEYNEAVCVRDKDLTSASAPAVYHISPNATAHADGSAADPCSLQTALNQLYHAYTNFLLLPGEHHLKKVIAFAHRSARELSARPSPFIVRLEIASRDCAVDSATCGRARISYSEQYVYFDMLSIASIEISHVDFVTPLQSGACVICLASVVLFSVPEGGELALTHVSFRHFHGVLHTVVKAEGGTVRLTDVDFIDIAAVPSWIETIETIAIVNNATLEYSGGTVALLNNGAPYGSSSQILHFLICDSATVTVRNVTFSHNFAEAASADFPVVSLVKLGVCRQCSFRGCTFRNNIANSIVHYQGDFRFATFARDSWSLLSDSIEFVDCEFVNNTATFGTLTFYGGAHLPDLTIRNCTFTNELSASYGLISLQVPKTAFRSTGTWKHFTEGNRQVRVEVPAASALLSGLRFSNCTVTQFGLIAVTNFPVVQVRDVAVDSSGAFQEVDRYSNTLRDFERFGGSVPANTPLVPVAKCSSLLDFAAVRNLSITALRSNAAKCKVRLRASGDLVTLSDSVFSAGTQSEDLLLDIQASQPVSITSTAFSQSTAGAVVVKGSALVSGCSFHACVRAVAVQSADTVTVQHSQFLRGQGNSVTLYFDSGAMRLQVRNCTFEQNVAAGEGGIIAMLVNRNTAQIALLITESQFLNNRVPEGSALLFLQKLTFTDDSEISSSEFANNDIGTLYLASSAGDLRIHECVFSNSTGGTLVLECSQACSITLSSLTFVNSTGNSVTLRRSSALGADLHFSMNQGVCFHLTASELAASGVLFADNSADSGPALTLSSSRAALWNSTFRHSSARTIGGAVLAQARSEFNCSACTFESLSAALGGAIFAKHESAVSLNCSRLLGNSAGDGFAVLVAASSRPSFIGNSEVAGNFGKGFGAISLMNAALVFVSSAMYNNTSSDYTAGLVAQLSSVLIADCSFSDQHSTSGSFLYASHSELRAANSRFSAGVAETAGGAVLASETALFAENCTFRSLKAPAGGALALQSSSSITLQDCEFLGIQSSGKGVIEVVQSTLRLVGASVLNYQQSAIVAEAAILDIARSEFADNGMPSTGGGIACEECSYVSISHSRFTRLQAVTGSAVYLNSASPSQSHWEITDCEFSGNTATAAGTVWLKGGNATVSGSRFSGNSAGDYGGGIALLGPLSTLHNNSFLRNRAVKGAGVYWRGPQPAITDCRCEGNEAVYGDCLGSFAVAMELEGNSTVQDLPSGQVSPAAISLLLVDEYGQIVTSDDNSDGWLETQSSDVNLTGATRAIANRGRLLFSDFTVIAQPASNVSLFAHTSALSSYRLEVRVGMRGCARGEMQSGAQCVVCEAGTYSLDPSQPCKKCPFEAICLGNSTLTPRSGYWRLDKFTDQFFRCPNQASCLGSPGPTANLTGACADGYEGNKCQSCSVGYYRWGKVSCAKCPPVDVQVAVRLSIVAFLGLLSVLIIRSALQERRLHSAYAKAYVDYLQLVMLLGSFHLQWPYIMQRLFNAQESIGAFLEIAFSLRCMWREETESETYFHELIMFSLFPVFLVALSCCVWLLISLCTRIPEFWHKLLVSATVLYFLAYPSVIRVMASAWAFEEIGDGELWVAGLQQRAFTHTHLKYAVGLALPCGLLIGILIPFGLAVVMKRSKRTNSLQFGFLWQRYRDDRYYWKFVVTIRLALVVMCIPLFSRTSPAFQVVSALAVLLVSLLLHRLCRPFADATSNALESQALAIAIMTLYAGLFYYAGKPSPVAEVTLSAFIIGANVYFSVKCWRKSIFILAFTVADQISKRITLRRVA